jgi:hypothetical protein
MKASFGKLTVLSCVSFTLIPTYCELAKEFAPPSIQKVLPVPVFKTPNVPGGRNILNRADTQKLRKELGEKAMLFVFYKMMLVH